MLKEGRIIGRGMLMKSEQSHLGFTGLGTLIGIHQAVQTLVDVLLLG
jgi:hypothetical protein